ncbi:hypothetical protein K2X83_00100 [Patescibacteria group bacterium]|nr:hypothetical protein [Patescibacteria group bacterium]
MKRAGSFLDRFEKLTPPNDAVRRAVAEAIRKVTGVPVTREKVKVVRGVAFVTCSSVARNAIRIARGKIFEELAKILPKAGQQVREIR